MSILQHYLRLIMSKSPMLSEHIRIQTHNGIPIPPKEMRNKVRKGALLADDFISEGKQVYQELIKLLTDKGITLQKPIKIFEFGCGCGRIARHFLKHESIEYYGSDVDKELIEWCNGHIPNYHFEVNSYEPPLIYPDNYFDLVICISVFTHLPLTTQTKWFKELHRVISKKGFVIISIIEKSSSELSEGVFVKERIDPDIKRHWLSKKKNNPGVYYNAYHSVDYIQKNLLGLYEIVEVRNRVIRDKQTLIMLRPV